MHQHDESCKAVFSLLSEYLTLELPPELRAQMEAHLAGCSPCIEFCESLRKTVELCRQYRPSELPGPLGKAARTQLLVAYEKLLAGRNDPQLD
jgi:RNA polymerase sigma-70 factor, ECF subfamily